MAAEEDEDKKKNEVLARIIIEVLGGPKSHVEETLRLVVDEVEKQGFIVENKEFVEAEEKGKLFSAFCEIEVRYKTVYELIGFCFDFMPSSVEIIEPEHFQLSNFGVAGLLNDLLAKLHAIDMSLKNTNAKNMLLETNALHIVRNSIMVLLREGSKTGEELSKETGIKSDNFDMILDVWVKEGYIELNDGKYSLSSKNKKETDGHDKEEKL